MYKPLACQWTNMNIRTSYRLHSHSVRPCVPLSSHTQLVPFHHASYAPHPCRDVRLGCPHRTATLLARVFWFGQSDLVRPLWSLFSLHLLFAGAHRTPLLITAQESPCVRRPVVHKEENFKDNDVESGDEDHDDENLRGGERKRALTRQAMLASVIGSSHVSLG